MKECSNRCLSWMKSRDWFELSWLWFLQEVAVKTFKALCNNEKGFKKKLT